MRDIYIKSKAGLLPIGRRGENLATRVIYPGAPESGQAVTVYVLRNGDTAAYPASEIEITDTEIIWTVTSVDTDKSGRGKVQYRFADSVTGEVIKTEIYYFIVGLALDTEVGPAPDPYETWLDSLTGLAEQTQTAARDAEDEATNAHVSATSATASEASARQSAISAEASAESAQAASESAEQTAQAVTDAVGLLREQIYNSYPNVTAETAPIVSITDGADGIPVKSLVVGIEPVQSGSGDPSPDNVRPITGWTGAQVTRCGKNLFNVDAPNLVDGYITTTGFSNSNPKAKTVYIQIKPSTTYTVSKLVGQRFAIATAPTPPSNGVDFTLRNAGTATQSQKTITSSANDAYLWAWCYLQDTDTVTLEEMLASVQLEIGSTATAYEPYQGETYDITFPSEAGTVYGGSLDVTNGVLTVDRAQIASYAGETLPGEWISDRDVYAEGTAPTTGAQVVYTLATPQTYTLTPTEVITTLLGFNNLWADTGDVQEMAYRADTKLYIDRVYGEG